MEIGIVGLPNVGKSSLFNALTGEGIAAENFPFTTIEPNIGVVPIDDARLDTLQEKFNSQKKVPSGIRFMDIAGLVKGASQGEGLGNKFLGNIRSVDAICHVVRCFTDDDVVNVMGDLNPVHAADIVETELIISDLQQAEKGIDKLRKNAKTGEKTAKDRVVIMEGIIAKFDEGVSARNQDIPADFLKEYKFLTAKPILYVANTDESGANEDLMAPLRERAAKDGAQIVELCTKIESEILELPKEERDAYYEDAGITSPGLARLAKAGEKLLGLITFFTAGPQEARAWHIMSGTTAVNAAAKIHTDIQRGFIRAEIYHIDQLVEFGSESAMQAKGLVRLEGKEYVVNDGDVIYFRFNV